MRWGVVGSSDFALGSVVPALHASTNSELRAIVTRDPARVTAMFDDPSVVVTSRLADLVDAGVEIVHLVVPNNLHLPLALECFSLGLSVLVEKPMALNVEEAEQLSTAAAASGLLLAVGSCMAWSPVVTRAGQLLAAGELGRVFHAELSVAFDTGENRGWRQLTPTLGGGGVLNDLGAHAIDALVRLFGPVESVSAILATTLPNHASDDTASLLLRHPEAVTSAVHLGFTHGCNDFAVVSQNGRLTSTEWLGRRFAGDLVFDRGTVDAARFEIARHDRVDELAGTRPTDVVERQADEVSAAIRGDGELEHADVATGLHVMRVIHAAIRSSETGRREAV